MYVYKIWCVGIIYCVHDAATNTRQKLGSNKIECSTSEGLVPALITFLEQF